MGLIRITFCYKIKFHVVFCVTAVSEESEFMIKEHRQFYWTELLSFVVMFQRCCYVVNIAIILKGRIKYHRISFLHLTVFYQIWSMSRSMVAIIILRIQSCDLTETGSASS